MEPFPWKFWLTYVGGGWLVFTATAVAIVRTFEVAPLAEMLLVNFPVTSMAGMIIGAWVGIHRQFPASRKG